MRHNLSSWNSVLTPELPKSESLDAFLWFVSRRWQYLSLSFMNYELERIRKEVIVVEWSSYPWVFLMGLRKTTKMLRMAVEPVAIRTEHPQNTILERYRCTSMLDISSCRTTKLLPWKIVPPEERCTQPNPFTAHVSKTCFDTVWVFLLSDVPLYRTGFPFPGDFHSSACRKLKWRSS
jgi:hypothetical protein